MLIGYNLRITLYQHVNSKLTSFFFKYKYWYMVIWYVDFNQCYTKLSVKSLILTINLSISSDTLWRDNSEFFKLYLLRKRQKIFVKRTRCFPWMWAICNVNKEYWSQMSCFTVYIVWFLQDKHVYIFFIRVKWTNTLSFIQEHLKVHQWLKNLLGFQILSTKNQKSMQTISLSGQKERQTFCFDQETGAWNKIPVDALKFLLAFVIWSLYGLKDLLVKTNKGRKGYRLICSLKSSILLESNCENINKPSKYHQKNINILD